MLGRWSNPLLAFLVTLPFFLFYLLYFFYPNSSMALIENSDRDSNSPAQNNICGPLLVRLPRDLLSTLIFPVNFTDHMT